jgi:hypothetical protein
MSDKKALGGAVPPQSSGPTFTPQPPPQANQSVPTPQPYGVVPGIPTGSPYVIPGQTQIYPQGPPPTYDQALTHPAAIVGQPMYHPGTMYAAGYPTYLGYPTYAPMQYYPSLGAYSYAMQPAQLRPTIMIPVSRRASDHSRLRHAFIFSERVRRGGEVRRHRSAGASPGPARRATVRRSTGSDGGPPGRARTEEKLIFGGRFGRRLHLLVGQGVRFKQFKLG